MWSYSPEELEQSSEASVESQEFVRADKPRKMLRRRLNRLVRVADINNTHTVSLWHPGAPASYWIAGDLSLWEVCRLPPLSLPAHFGWECNIGNKQGAQTWSRTSQISQQVTTNNVMWPGKLGDTQDHLWSHLQRKLFRSISCYMFVSKKAKQLKFNYSVAARHLNRYKYRY